MVGQPADFEKPTPIQEAAIPVVLQGHDDKH
jgi:superfamily II DNA/RNA helicase